MASHGDDELAAEQTEGFKVGEQKTIDEYQKLGTLNLCIVTVNCLESGHSS